MIENMDKGAERRSEILRFVQMIGLVGAAITLFVFPVSWWSHSIHLLILLVAPILSLLAGYDDQIECLVWTLCEKLAIMLLAFAWGSENGGCSQIWGQCVVFVIVISNSIYLSLTYPNKARSNELKIKEAQARENLQTTKKPESKDENKNENAHQSEGDRALDLMDKHFTMFAEGIAKPVIERAESELNHSEFYKTEFEKMREISEKKEEKFVKEAEKLEETIKKLRGEVSDIAADLYMELSESEYLKNCLEEKIVEKRSIEEEVSDLRHKLYVESTSCLYYKECNDFLAGENLKLNSNIVGLENEISDLNDELYIASSKPRLFQNLYDENDV